MAINWSEITFGGSVVPASSVKIEAGSITIGSTTVKQFAEYGAPDLKSFHFQAIDEREAVLVSGVHNNKRYEFIIGTYMTSDSDLDVFRNVVGTEWDDTLDWAVRKGNVLLSTAFRKSGKDEYLEHPGFLQQVSCPGGKRKCGARSNLQDTIIHLNDTHRWSREAIAEWIDTLDEQPIFYPQAEVERVANSARVVTLQSALPGDATE
jgi:hypothetical protein